MTSVGSVPKPQQMARMLAVLFTAASVVTVLGLLAPHEPEVDEVGLAVVAALTGLAGLGLALGRERLPVAVYHGVPAFGTLNVSLAVLFNGERNGGPAGGEEMYYLWVALCAAYYLGRVGTAAHVAVILASYAATLIVVDPGPIAVSRWLSLAGLVIGAAVVVRLLRERDARLVAALHEAARTDPLTGLANRRAFEEASGRELGRARRSGAILTLLVADVDRFKQINDRFGHAAGDEALQRVAAALRQQVRGSDRAARLGGDEFALLLPDTGAEGARAAGERVRDALSEAAGDLPVALSFGVAQHGVHGHALDELMRAADAELYAEKRRPQAASGRSSAPAAAPSTRATSS